MFTVTIAKNGRTSASSAGSVRQVARFVLEALETAEGAHVAGSLEEVQRFAEEFNRGSRRAVLVPHVGKREGQDAGVFLDASDRTGLERLAKLPGPARQQLALFAEREAAAVARNAIAGGL
jgi:hypothetical protein